MSSVSQRLVLVGVEGSLQISQKPQSRKCQKMTKMTHLDLCEKHLTVRSLANLCVNRAHADVRERMVKGRLEAAAAEQQLSSSRVGRFSVQSAAAAAAACIENPIQRVQPRAPVGRGLRELSPGSNPVNHSRNNVATPEFSSLDLVAKSYNMRSRHLPDIEPPLSQNISLDTKTDRKNPKKSLAKSGYKEPKSKQDFSSYFLHFATPRPFYRAHSFL